MVEMQSYFELWIFLFLYTWAYSVLGEGVALPPSEAGIENSGTRTSHLKDGVFKGSRGVGQAEGKGCK